MSLIMSETSGLRLLLMGAPAAFLLMVMSPFSQVYAQEEVYTAELKPVNQQVSETAPVGRAEFRLEDDALTITVTASNLKPDTMYLQHLHGFMNGDDAACATPEHDLNNDGIIDIKEAEQVSGMDMIPITDNPVGLEIITDTYPVSSSEGVIQYSRTVSMSELKNSVKNRYGVDDLDLEDMVFMLHGVSPDMALPDSVKSAHGLPPQATLPIACGEIQER